MSFLGLSFLFTDYRTIMPSTVVIVAGTAAHVFLPTDNVQSCLSTRFVQTHIPWKSLGSLALPLLSWLSPLL
jgi:hypothetical protein